MLFNPKYSHDDDDDDEKKSVFYVTCVQLVQYSCVWNVTDDADVYDYPNWFDDSMHFRQRGHDAVVLSCEELSVHGVQGGVHFVTPSN